MAITKQLQIIKGRNWCHRLLPAWKTQTRSHRRLPSKSHFWTRPTWHDWTIWLRLKCGSSIRVYSNSVAMPSTTRKRNRCRWVEEELVALVQLNSMPSTAALASLAKRTSQKCRRTTTRKSFPNQRTVGVSNSHLLSITIKGEKTINKRKGAVRSRWLRRSHRTRRWWKNSKYTSIDIECWQRRWGTPWQTTWSHSCWARLTLEKSCSLKFFDWKKKISTFRTALKLWYSERIIKSMQLGNWSTSYLQSCRKSSNRHSKKSSRRPLSKTFLSIFETKSVNSSASIQRY